jgi:DNA adenine methylase
MIAHPIPYQGSKRAIARHILTFFPHDIGTLIEPFAGSAAVSIAAATNGKASQFHLNDINSPLMDLWKQIIQRPDKVSSLYRGLWNQQLSQPRKYYDLIRDKFNRTKQPELLLYLLARCVKASIRYNPKGEFNQSPDNRRLGRDPERMASDIFAVSNLFRGRTQITNVDYTQVFAVAKRKDLLYMDPPYQGVCNNGDPRYLSGIQFEDIMDQLNALNQRDISFILSYDGRTGKKSFGTDLPRQLKLHKIEIEAGASSQSTLLGRSAITYESLYLSPSLVERLAIRRAKLPKTISRHTTSQIELPLFK